MQQFTRLYGTETSPGRRLRVVLAMVLAAAAGVLAWWGLVLRSRADVPLAKLSEEAAVQIGVPVALVLLLVVAGWLLRGVVLARLQFAVIISLLLHLLLMLALQVVRLPEVLAQVLDPVEILPEESQITLPDYGGMESPDAEPEIWQMSTSVDTPEVQLQEPARQTPEPVQPRAEEQQAELMPEEKIELAERRRVEMQKMQLQSPSVPQDALSRQAPQQPTPSDQPAELPKLSEERVRDMSPRDTAAMLDRQAAAAEMRERETADVRLPELSRSAAEMESKRADDAATSPEQAQLAAARSASELRAAESRADAPQLTAAERAAEMTLSEARGDVQRQQAQLASRAPQAPAASLSAARASAASVNSARADMAPQLSGTSGPGGSLARAQASGGGVQGTAGPAEAPAVAPGGAAGSFRAEAAPTRQARAAGGGVRGPTGPGPTAPAAAARVGTGGVAVPGRVAARDGVGPPTGPAGEGSAPLARGSVAGGVAVGGTTGESLRVVDTPGGSGNVQLAARSAASGSGRGASAAIPTGVGRGGIGAGTSAGPGSGTGRSAVIPGGSPARGSEMAGLPSDTAGGSRAGAGLGTRAARSGGGVTGTSGGIEREAMALTPGPQPGGGIEPGPLPGGAAGSGRAASGAAGAATLGPRTSAPRRAAGLPGSAAGAGQIPGTGQGLEAGLPAAAKLTVGAPARREQSGDSAPETHPVAAQLARQAATSLGAADRAVVSPAFSLRTGELRKEAAKTFGGSPETERAVERGLAWLAQHQAPNGSWSIHGFTAQCKEHQCDGPGSFQSDTAATGLALLAFLGAGYTHQSGQYQDTVARGLKWLTSEQKPDGDLFNGDAPYVRLYSHSMAAIALCEAYGMTKDERLREPTQRAMQFIIDSQHPQQGGWRYVPRQETDTSVSGWALMALKSGEMAGFGVPPAVYQRVGRWLDTVERGPSGGVYTYHPTRPESVAMTAEGLLMRQYLGFRRDNPRLRAGANYLDARLPELAERDAYYWYYGTQVMYHMQGPHWAHWNGRLRDLLTSTQSQEGGTAGSWSPEHPTPDRWSSAGGRMYVTCLHLLVLEVYYRHLPLYQQLGPGE
jgi:chemotaxis protein histidine kinase CheA